MGFRTARRGRLAPLFLIGLLASATSTGLLATATAAQDAGFDDVAIEVTPVADGLHMLTGRGGNMAAVSGPEGVLLVDDQFAPLTEKIQAAVATISDRPIRFVVNTHWHWDHTGGNENLGRAGAVIVSHAGVRRRMSTEQFIRAFDRRVPASPASALPIVTFEDAVTLHVGALTVRAVHAPAAHTDGDAIIWFDGANAVHLGDVYFNRRYPFIDIDAGGSVDGVIAAVEGVLEVADAETRMIPGHGPLSSVEELRAYRDLLRTVRDRVVDAIGRGLSEDRAVAEKPSEAFDAVWGNASITPELFVRITYRDLQERVVRD